MKLKTLNKMYSLYSKGEINQKELEGLIYSYYNLNQEKTCLSHWERHVYEDYISWFYPRLKKAIESYKFKGSTFESYMGKFLYISSKEYSTRTTTKSIIEYSAWCARVPDMYVREEAPVYHHEKNEDIILKIINDKNGRKEKKRILALIIKCYYYLSDDFIERVAPMLGLEKCELKEMIEKIKKIRNEKDDRIYAFKERIYCQYYRCLIFENRLSHMHESSVSYNKIKDKLDKAKITLNNMRKRYAKIRTDATNKQVALVIGSTKGTVDASLHQLKERFGNLMKNPHLN